MKKFIFIATIVVVFCGFFTIILSLYPIKYRTIVLNYSRQYGLDKHLVFGLINAESGFDKNAISAVGACGLMQIMPATANEVGAKLKMHSAPNLFDENDNINVGCYYLKYLLNMYNGNEVLALCAYNAGYNNVNSWMESGFDGTPSKIPVSETKKYVNKVLKAKKIYKILYV